MADLRDQLRKAGLISDKELRQAKHKERVHAAKAGKDGLAKERHEEAERTRAERERRRDADRAREKERCEKEKEAKAANRLQQLIRSGSIRDASIGNKRFYFATRSGRITYLELTDIAVRRLAAGSAAIVEEGDSLFGTFRVVSDLAADEISGIEPERILFWNR